MMKKFQPFSLLIRVKVLCEDDEIEVDYHLYSIELKTIDGDVSLPHNNFQSCDFQPNG